LVNIILGFSLIVFALLIIGFVVVLLIEVH